MLLVEFGKCFLQRNNISSEKIVQTQHPQFSSLIGFHVSFIFLFFILVIFLLSISPTLELMLLWWSQEKNKNK